MFWIYLTAWSVLCISVGFTLGAAWCAFKREDKVVELLDQLCDLSSRMRKRTDLISDSWAGEVEKIIRRSDV